MIACAEVTQAEGNGVGRDALGCRGPSENPLESVRTCRRGAGYRGDARSCMLGAICRRFGGWSVEKLEYWYGKLGFALPVSWSHGDQRIMTAWGSRRHYGTREQHPAAASPLGRFLRTVDSA